MEASVSPRIASRPGGSPRLRLLSAIFLALLLFFFPFPVRAQRGNTSGRSNGIAEINVQVRNPNGSAAPRGIHVRLEAEEGGATDDCVTESSGKCRFQPRTAGMYVVRLNQIGYKEVSVHVNLVDSLKGFVTLDLKPDHPEAQQPDTPDGVSGDSISAVELNIPEKARQEFEKGQSAMRENRLDAGISHLRKAIKFYDAYPTAYTLLGTAYLEQKNWKDAETALQKSISFDPNSADAHLALGAAFNQTKDYPNAETALLRGLELKPEAFTGHYELAKTYWALGRWREAAPHVRKAVSDMPDVASPHVLLGNVLLRENNPKEAVHEYQEYLRLDPNGLMAPGVRQMIDKIQKSPPP